jgi:lysozyme family protein
MASFKAAIGHILKHEGGYVNDPDDRGGETNFGISKARYPHLNIKKLTRAEAIEIYHSEYWRVAYDTLTSQAIATKVFDLAVNMGHRPAHQLLQQAVNGAGGGVRLKVDGILGPKTVARANLVNTQAIMRYLRARAAVRYAMIAVKNQTQAKFLFNWMIRNQD